MVIVMDLFSPDLSQYWLNSIEADSGRDDGRQQVVEIQRAEQEAAWSALTERVQAARTVV
jgi:hypothetical protein